ncbi:hypothetical protein [Wolbachia endosymbiont (group A) of Lypha dubia]|uniref:hypothetical protein n=1 Tax=Wolbachia endosymbiont (group A) of Lypha dubia TaxID=3066146 RepID=UPI003341E377
MSGKYLFCPKYKDVIQVPSSCHPSAPFFVIQVADTGIQVAHKQTSIESGYNVFDEIAERLDPSVKHWDDRGVG